MLKRQKEDETHRDGGMFSLDLAEYHRMHYNGSLPQQLKEQLEKDLFVA